LKIPVAKADVGAAFEHTVIEVALATGARSGAILELEWDRVDFEKGIIDSTAASRPNFLLAVFGARYTALSSGFLAR
jgi:hypothetical protein